MSKQKLKIIDLTLGYDKKVIAQDINLEANEGDFIALMGNNGCGKSTLIKAISNMAKPLNGSILIDGKPVESYSKNKLSLILTVVLTESVQTPDLSVYEVVSFGRYPHTNWFGKLGKEDKMAIENAMEKVSITGFSQRNIGSLSDGEKQRTLIAKSLAQNCDIMLFDEPTAHLDIKNRNSMMKLLKEVASSGRTVIISTHDLELAKKYASNIWLMETNSKTHFGTPESMEKSGLFNRVFELESGNYSSKISL